MPLEFSCPFCSKVLKTADEKAGMSAKCPGCGQVLVVPGLPGYGSAPPPPPGDDAAARPRDTGFAEVPPEFGGGPTAAEGPAAGADATRPCPMCGGQIRPEARVCRHCGERVKPERVVDAAGRPGELVPTEIEAGAVLSIAWELMREHMGMAIVGTLLPQMALTFVMMVAYGMGFLLAFLISGGRELQPEAVTVAMIPIALVIMPLVLFINVGQIRFMLTIARGESPQIIELVQGGPYVLRAIGLMFLFGIMTQLGVLCFCVGALAVAVIFGPCFHTLVDRNCGVIESLDLTRKFTMVNIGPQCLLMLATGGILVLSGICTLGLANVVTLPYVMLVQAVAYKMMTGQPVGGRKR